MISPGKQRVAILGASDKPDRYSFKALQMLREHGHEALPVHPRLTEIDGLQVSPSLPEVEGPVDTLTLYVNPAISEPLTDEIVALQPGRVIFNPGTESQPLKEALEGAGISTQEACTLVLLSTNQFEL
jgi:predicted CoA-binding protein